MAATSIEWTDVSWPVLNGCRRASPGCLNCYAERLSATRLRNHPKYRGLAVYQENGPRWTGESRLWSPELTMPLRLRTPKKIFVCDMGDLFYDGNSDEEIDCVFGVMWACLYLGRNAVEGHVFQVLTKRAERMREYLSTDRREQWARMAVNAGGEYDPDGIHDQVMNLAKEPHPRIWLGVSCENQEWANERIPHLLATPAAVRFASAEPLIGPIDFTRIANGSFAPFNALSRWTSGRRVDGSEAGPQNSGIDWIIVGSESGPGARPMAIEWAESIRDQCAEADVSFFTKQLATDAGRLAGDRKGGEPMWWPAGEWPREFPKTEARPCQ